MNIVQLQDQLKNFSQDQLVREMQMPSGNAPPYLVLSEIMRRKQMETAFAGQQAPQETVAQEAVAAAGVPQGGIADMARALAPQTDMTQNTGVQAMAKGGPVKKMQEGGAVMTDPAVRTLANRVGMTVEEYLEAVGPERAAAIRADADRRAASQVTSSSNVFDPRLAVTGTQAATGDMSTSFEQQKDDSLFNELGVNPSRTFGGADQYDRGMPELPTLQETFAADNPFSYPVPATPISDFREPPERPSIFSEMGGTVSEIAQNYRDARLRASQQGDLRAQGSDNRPLTAAEQAVADQRGEIFGGIWDLAGRVGRAIDDNLVGPAAAFGKGTQALGARALATGATLIPGLEGFAVNMAGTEEAALKDAARLAREGVFPNAPATAEEEEADRVENLKAAYTQMAGTMGQAGITSLAGNKPNAAAPKTDTPTPETDPAPDAAQPSGGGGGGAGGGAGRTSSYEQMLMDTLASREKAATQDKWLALAQVGLNMMSSTNPTLLGAIGESGLKGVETARAARDQYDKDKLDILGAIEQSRLARAAAAARAASGGITAYQAAQLARNERKDLFDELSTIQTAISTMAPTGVPLNPEDMGEVEQLKAYAKQLTNQLFGASAADTNTDGTYNVQNN
jgi:hypothetical protein